MMDAVAETRSQQIASGARGIAPPLYAFFGSLSGATQGFVTVTLSYILVQHGFSVAAVAGLIGLRLLPETWRVVFGPMLDMSLDPRRWYVLCAIGSCICIGLFAIVPLQPSQLPILAALALGLGIFASCATVAYTAAISVSSPLEARGRIAGWVSSGNLAGVGLGGGLGLWIASHQGFATAVVAIAVWCLVTGWPNLILRAPRVNIGAPLVATVRGLGKVLAGLAVTRAGVLAILAVTLPLGLGGFINLLPAVAGAWRVSADTVAATSGALAGLASVPGCLIGGWLCSRSSSRTVLAASGLVCAVGELAMAFGPRTPEAFVGLSLLNNLLLGVAYAAVAAVIYDALQTVGGGTVGALLGSLCNAPLVIMTMVLGAAEKSVGATGMMVTEAACGVVSALVYGLLAWSWRPAIVVQPVVVAAI